MEQNIKPVYVIKEGWNKCTLNITGKKNYLWKKMTVLHEA